MMLKYVKKCQKQNALLVCETSAQTTATMRKCGRCELRLVLYHYVKVRLGVIRGEMELTRTCCFEFDRKPREWDKLLFLHTFCLYFRVAWFTYWSLHPEVDKLNVPP